MAAIDKIYGTTEQYDEFWEWCEKHLPKVLEFFYERDGYLEGLRPITNLPQDIDTAIMWSEDNPPAWAAERIKEQYGCDLEALLYGDEDD